MHAYSKCSDTGVKISIWITGISQSVNSITARVYFRRIIAPDLREAELD